MSGSPEPFPRGIGLPKQSPLFWAAEKDRYLRQLLLRDLAARWKRRQLVYFTRCDGVAQIDMDDDRPFAELLSDCGTDPIDLHLETNGGYTDAAEKLLTMLHPYRRQLRVIVARRAKSNGTLLAIAADQIVMGEVSELGPIDPNITLGPGQSVPAQFVLQAPGADPILHQIAASAVSQTKGLATQLLTTGQFASKVADVAKTVDDLSGRSTYPSHGSVIDCKEAQRLGLNVTYFAPDTDDWKWVWMLRCLYEQDARRNGLVKIFEGHAISNSVRQ
ncbi:MAG: hypothetical protein HIU92_02525 [Proteobacteria bacterium]|nr:hypothetical protein [Pseudomonadota bacterium]